MLRLLLLFALPPLPAQAAVNCAAALKEAQVPVCVALEEAPRMGCGNDLMVPKEKAWAGKAQMKLAQTTNAANAQECLTRFTHHFSKNSCCRQDVPKPKPRPKAVKKAAPAQKKAAPKKAAPSRHR